MVSSSPNDGETIEVVVGRIGKPHGIRGEVTIDVRSDEPERRFADGAVAARRAAAAARRSPLRTLTVARSRWHQPTLLVTFEELADRNAAEAARGIVLHATISTADESPEDPDEYYDHQLVGLAAHDLDGTLLGEVTALVHGGAQDLLAHPHARRPRHAGALRHARWCPRSTSPAAGSSSPTGPGWSRRCPRTSRHRPMRIDYVTIFPDYLAPLELSLAGQGRRAAG